MNEDQIKELFRKTELSNRAIRRQCLINEAALDKEPLPPDEIEKAALAAVTDQERRYQRAARGGYWKNLWLAFKGR